MAIIRHFSAGGIVIKKEKGVTKVLVTQHSSHKGWDFPKGHLNAGESSRDAALREVFEETGVKGEILEKAGVNKYYFVLNGEKFFKTVTYFFMKFAKQGKATTAWEVSDKIWLPVDQVDAKLTFESTKKMWDNARKRIEQLTIDN